MGGMLDKPNQEKHTESQDGAGLRCALSAMQGYRVNMEDRHTMKVGIPELSKSASWFAVFDGHSSDIVSEHCSKYLLPNLIKNSDFKEAVIKENQFNMDKFKKKIQNGLISGFLKQDEELRENAELIKGSHKGGTTSICALLTEKYITFANLGDSRGLISSKVGNGSKSTSVLATIDHKPASPEEEKRIKKAGGCVINNRVNGQLAVSRVFGDFEYKGTKGKDPKKQLITPEPEIYVRERDANMDEFMVLACDGVWDVMSNEDIVDFIADRMRVTADLEKICNLVLDTCLHKGSRDNMSIILIAFPAAPKVDSEAKQKDEKLDLLIQQKITEMVQKNKSIAFLEIWESLSKEKFEDLPAAGGIESKKQYMIQVYDKLCPKQEKTADSSNQEDSDNAASS